MKLSALLSFLLIKKCIFTCFVKNIDGSLDGKQCRKRTITADETLTDCLTYYSYDRDCFLHHLKDYYCCYNYVEYDDGVIEDDCNIWYKEEIDKDAVFKSIEDYRATWGVSGTIVLDCKSERINLDVLWKLLGILYIIRMIF